MIKFITGNQGKLEEARTILGDVAELNIDLTEIQEIDPHKIIAAKLEEAKKFEQGEFIVEDTSLYLEGLNGLPGPLIKWFLKTIGNEGLVNISKKLDSQKAEARTIIGHLSETGDINYYEGVIKGEIVEPRGEGFGWDPIFKPGGHEKTFGEMSAAEKNQISMRRLALEKLKEASK